jgi:hypothetical protein
MMKFVTDGAGLQTKIYAESPDGPILMATAVNYDVAEHLARAVNHFDEVVEVLRLAREGFEDYQSEAIAIDALLSKLEASHGSA